MNLVIFSVMLLVCSVDFLSSDYENITEGMKDFFEDISRRKFFSSVRMVLELIVGNLGRIIRSIVLLPLSLFQILKQKKKPSTKNWGGLKYCIGVYKEIFDLRHPIRLFRRFFVATIFLFGMIFINFFLSQQFLQPGQSSGSNVVRAPFLLLFGNHWLITVLAWLTVISILVALPLYANLEEIIFRYGTHTPWGMLLRSFIFGFAHMTAGVNWIIGLVLSFGGMFYSIHYWYGGLEQATIYHFLNNFIVLMFLLSITIINYIAWLQLQSTMINYVC